jgi:hypothetical protein
MHNHRKKKPEELAGRESSSLLRFDMRLPARVKAELDSGKPGRALREYVDKVKKTATDGRNVIVGGGGGRAGDAC